jgi:glycosyltransferase involved in cell wall biosynthesis
MKLTIITINYANASGLQKTMKSVLNQTSKDFEYIVIDGGAPFNPPKGGKRDRDVIEAFIQNKEEVIDGFVRCTYLSPFGGVGGGFFSKPDNGIYHAMNKGIRMAKGDYIHFLNSGDWLVDDRVVENMLADLPDCDIFVGNVISVRPDGKRRYNQNEKEISLLTFYRGTIQHTSAYIKRSLFDKYGLYDEGLKIVSDWKWYLQVAGLNQADVRFTDRYVSCFDTTGISSTQLDKDKAERRKVLEELIPAPVLSDYDRYYFVIDQFERLKRYPILYKIVWFVERVLFKIDKWRGKRGWR